MPIVRELRIWWRLKSHISLNRNLIISGTTILVLIAIISIPWNVRIQLPALMSYQSQNLFAPDTGQIDKVLIKKGDKVKQGQLLATMHSPLLQYKILRTKEEIAKLEWALRSTATEKTSIENINIIEQKLSAERTRLAGLYKNQQQLVLKAPFNGYVEYLYPSLRHAIWIKSRQLLITVINPNKTTIEAYIRSADLADLSPNKKAEFIAEDLAYEPIPCLISDIDYQHIKTLQIKTATKIDEKIDLPHLAYLISQYGGHIVMRNTKEGLIPEQSIRRISFTPVKPGSIKNALRGQVYITIKQDSMISRILKQIAAVIIRESGF